MNYRKVSAVTEILIANLFWGAGFFATIWALKELSPAAIVFYRFFIAAVASVVLFFAAQILFNKNFSWDKALKTLRTAFQLSVPAGISMGITILLQTWGLLTTTAGKSAFITVLYVVFTPFLEILFYKRRLLWTHWVAVLISLLGIALMTQMGYFSFIQEGESSASFFDGLTFGDFLTLLCAIGAAFHIIYVGKLSQNPKILDGPGHLFLANAGQGFVVSMMCLPLIFVPGSWDITNLSFEPLVGMLLMTFGSSLIAFYLQLRAQRNIKASEASVLYLLESPFSALFGFLVLREVLTTTQLVGCGLILIGCVVSLKGSKKPA